eukprot:428271_1
MKPNQLILYSSLLFSLVALLHRSSTMAAAFGRKFSVGRSRMGAMFSLSLSKQTATTSSLLFKSSKRKGFFSSISSTFSGDIYQERMPSAADTVAGNAFHELTEEEKLLTRGIFCNTELPMKHITAVGFDMDYTLAQYTRHLDTLTFQEALKKLVYDLGYPEDILSLEYTHNLFTRGLVIDKENGNIIKMDKHRYVRKAFHGRRELSSEQRKMLYLSLDEPPDFRGDNWVNVDTFFGLVDCTLFAKLVEFHDSIGHMAHVDQGGLLYETANRYHGSPGRLGNKTYSSIYKDLKYCVHMCHCDGSIKEHVKKDPGRYIIPDPNVLPMIERLREQGKKVFLLTNSLWDYTGVVMNFLVGDNAIVDEREKRQRWSEKLFDIIIADSCKPSFQEDGDQPLYAVNPEDDSLSLVQCDCGQDAHGGHKEIITEKGTHIFHGGNWQHLHAMLGLKSGDKVLFVGDHVFADIARSKRHLGWRTCLVVPELQTELVVLQQFRNQKAELDKLRILQYHLDEIADILRYSIYTTGEDKKKGNELAKVEAEQALCKAMLGNENMKYHNLFHPVWGQLFKSGYQDSRFAQQVASYACIYTSHPSNLYQMSGDRTFRPMRDISAHDLHMEGRYDLMILQERLHLGLSLLGNSP